MARKVLHRLWHWVHETDKLQHILASLALVQVGVLWMDGWLAALVAFAVGWIKETGDYLFRNGFSWGDILANAVGVAMGLLLVSPWL
ncbi:hypothetical protein C7H09_18555 [Marinobacter fuscus]|uniref:VanZ-like domain-containing protein n=1 Tax=Marinobacter fuscus TaxID=2109942 RepID=A0A2T1K382_9GAMM|nr:hypothetical protein [Marinobacter fuscus]PSF04609.1 hypothetical protein C7H09_18555 [Marinobacter fuscus]